MDTYLVFLFVEHEGGNGPTLIGVGSGLSMNMNSGMANAKMVSRAEDSSERRRHLRSSDVRGR